MPAANERKIYVCLRDLTNGFYAVREHEWGHDDDGLIYQYRDGNYGCDCNRSLFLYAHAGLPIPPVDHEQRPWNDGSEYPCIYGAGKNRIVIDRITDEDGQVLWEGDAR